jgi:hypothetical protein
MNLIALAKLGLDASKIEDLPQLVKDGELLEKYYQIEKSGKLDFAKLTAVELEDLVPALARTLAVLNKMIETPSELANIMAVLASL